MIKIKPFLIATLLLTGFALPATAQIGEARSNLSVGVNGGVNLNSVSFTPSIKQNRKARTQRTDDSSKSGIYHFL